MASSSRSGSSTSRSRESLDRIEGVERVLVAEPLDVPDHGVADGLKRGRAWPLDRLAPIQREAQDLQRVRDHGVQPLTRPDDT